MRAPIKCLSRLVERGFNEMTYNGFGQSLILGSSQQRCRLEYRMLSDTAMRGFPAAYKGLDETPTRDVRKGRPDAIEEHADDAVMAASDVLRRAYALAALG